VRARRWEIGDHRLAQVIDLLAYERDSWDQPGSRDVDYTTLQVQHLGSIYEGLLELQPHIASEPLVETTQDGKVVFQPVSEVADPHRPIRGGSGRPSAPPRRIAPGEVYLLTHRGERKATGSYYTPKYIVDYIVEHTVGPLADQAASEVAALRPEVEREIQRLEKRSREFAGNAAEVEKAQQGMIEQKCRLLEPYLSLKILDPAMGSGHFLVGAADFLSLAMATDPHLPEELHGTEDPQIYYKRLIVERCLYGVDLNPLSVELAKLSLWLHTVSQDKALSFLDHHLR
jgi:type I restriction-modification system DNA methylase subunit